MTIFLSLLYNTIRFIERDRDKRMKLIRKLTINAVALAVTFSGVMSTAHGAEPIEEVRNYVKNYYVDKVDESVLHLPTIDDMLSKLDPYSTHLTAEEYQRFMNNINQSYVGIGIGLEQREQFIIIPKVYPNSPAEQAGLEEGDVIISVDGNTTFGLTLQQTAELIQGKEGTSITMVIQRGEETHSFRLTREEIIFPTVTTEPLAGNAGYLYIASFNDLEIKKTKILSFFLGKSSFNIGYIDCSFYYWHRYSRRNGIFEKFYRRLFKIILKIIYIK